MGIVRNGMPMQVGGYSNMCSAGGIISVFFESCNFLNDQPPILIDLFQVRDYCSVDVAV